MLIIGYKPLNVLEWIRYQIPNKSNLLKKLFNETILSKLDMKLEFWQIQIVKKDRYKIAFTILCGQYKWNVMSFELKTAPKKFQAIMNDRFNPYEQCINVYIDDVLAFSNDISQHWKHLIIFKNIVKRNGLVVS